MNLLRSSMSKFSIITTTYKHERFITQAIESVLCQSLTDWELLIGDDSPDDATWEIIGQYRQKYPDKIHAWHHTPNKGIVDNMNFLISQVSSDSEYIAFLEGDDIYTLDCLNKKLEIFQKYPEVALVYSDMDFVNTDSEITLRWLLRWQWTDFYHNELIGRDGYILARNPLIVSYSSIAIRKSILMEFSPIRNLTWSKTYAVSDYDLIFRIIENHKVYGIETSLTQYRRHANNLSASYGWLFDDLLLLLGEYRDTQKISLEVYQKKTSWVLILKSIAVLSSWDKNGSWNYLKKSLQENIGVGIIYKVAICVFLLLPISWTQKILQKRIRRGS